VGNPGLAPVLGGPDGGDLARTGDPDEEDMEGVWGGAVAEGEANDLVSVEEEAEVGKHLPRGGRSVVALPAVHKVI